MGPKRERRRSKNKATWPDRRLEIYSSDSMIDNLARNSSVGMLGEGPEEEIGSRCAGGCGGGGDMERQEYTGDIWTEIKWHSRAGVSFLCFSICCCGFFQVEDGLYPRLIKEQNTTENNIPVSRHNPE